MTRRYLWSNFSTIVVSLVVLCLAAAVVAAQEQQQILQQADRGPTPKVTPPTPFKSADGTKKGWKVVIPGGRPLATPAVIDGKVFLGGGFGSYEFYALDAKTGKLLWQYRTSDDGPTAAVVDEGYVTFNTESCELEVLDLAGKPVWKKWLGDPLMSMPAISNGRLFMAFPDSKGDSNHYLACFDLKTGKESWRKKLAGEIITAPIVDDDQVFLATLEGTVYCFRAKDGLLAWTEKGKNATSSPTVTEDRCWFSRRETKTETKDGKKVEQQTEQLAVRLLQKQAAVRDLAATSRAADYLDYGKRSGMGMGGMGGGMGGSPKEAASQAHDAGVGFSGGGVGLTEAQTAAEANPSQEAPPVQPGPATQPPGPPGVGAKGDSKINQAMDNLGQGSVHGVWSYQGSKPVYYKGRLYSSMGDTLLCVDPKTEKIVWQKQFQPKKEKTQEVLLDATVSPPSLVNDKVFVATGYGDIVCLSADNGEMVWKANIGESVVFQPAVADGRVYVGTESGNLYCVETGDPKDDGWLMWGANAAHTGRVLTGAVPK
jgi:outer membrane protein assembly factor BamB